MDMPPSAGVCFRLETIVVFIFNGGKKHHFGAFVKKHFDPANADSRSLSNDGVVVN
jgi:hypothetical protein